VATVLALATSLLWGCSDFLGGTTSRRLPPIVVIVWSELAALTGLIVIGACIGDLHLNLPVVGWGSAAGVVGLIGLGAFYRALADGAMGVVAPIAGLGVVVPVLVGVALGDRPDLPQVIGMAVGVVGIVLVSAGPNRSANRRILLLAGVAGAGFGSCFVFIDRATPHGLLMTMVLMRVAGCIATAAFAAVTGASLRPTGFAAPIAATAGLRVPVAAAVGLVGLLDVSANACFAKATELGSLAVVSVLSSLYPAVTALLARVVHDERLERIQAAGVAATVAAIVLLAAGPSA
jgi:drug/metabolite transporter (DMT)-like permease